jgi:hypothetical protein
MYTICIEHDLQYINAICIKEHDLQCITNINDIKFLELENIGIYNKSNNIMFYYFISFEIIAAIILLLSQYYTLKEKKNQRRD